MRAALRHIGLRGGWKKLAHSGMCDSRQTRDPNMLPVLESVAGRVDPLHAGQQAVGLSARTNRGECVIG